VLRLSFAHRLLSMQVFKCRYTVLAICPNNKIPVLSTLTAWLWSRPNACCMGSGCALFVRVGVLALAAAQLCCSRRLPDRRNGFLPVHADCHGPVLHFLPRVGYAIGVQACAWSRDSGCDRDCYGMARVTWKAHDVLNARRLAGLLGLRLVGCARLTYPWDPRSPTAILRLTVELVAACLFLHSCSATCCYHSCFAALFPWHSHVISACALTWILTWIWFFGGLAHQD